MNPMASIWYGVDPLAEKYVTAGGYIYTLENPINLVDPDGNKVIPKLYVNDSKKPVSYYRSPKNFSKAMKAFAKTMFFTPSLAKRLRLQAFIVSTDLHSRSAISFIV